MIGTVFGHLHKALLWDGKYFWDDSNNLIRWLNNGIFQKSAMYQFFGLKKRYYFRLHLRYKRVRNALRQSTIDLKNLVSQHSDWMVYIGMCAQQKQKWLNDKDEATIKSDIPSSSSSSSSSLQRKHSVIAFRIFFPIPTTICQTHMKIKSNIILALRYQFIC